MISTLNSIIVLKKLDLYLENHINGDFLAFIVLGSVMFIVAIILCVVTW